MTIEELKAQRRWVLWRLEKRDGKETKVPYQSSGYKADSTDPRTWQTYAEVALHAHRFSGVGVVLGTVRRGEARGAWILTNAAMLNGEIHSRVTRDCHRPGQL